MTDRQEARYGRSGWSWPAETGYNLAIGVLAVALGVVAVATHLSTFAVALGAVLFVAGFLLIATFARARRRRP